MPWRTVFACLLLPIALLAGGCNRAPSALDWTTAQRGFEYAVVDTADATGPGTRVHLLRYDPARFETVVVPASTLGERLADAPAFQRAAGAVAAINAGYFDPDFKPLGLLYSRGRQWSRLRQVDHGVFFVAAGRPGVVHARDWRVPQELEFAVECGPRLVVDGRPLTFKPGASRRVAIGHDAQGRVVVAVSEGPQTLADLGALLVRAEAAGGPELRAALNLDGGSSAMLALAAGAVRVEVRAPARVPVGLAIVARPGG